MSKSTGALTRTWMLAGAAAVALGCSSSSTGPSNGGGGPVGTVAVGNIYFQSGHNGTRNPAQDTVAVGQAVTWTWTGATSHSVRSLGTPSFPSSAVLTGAGQAYSVTFDAPGSYDYDCSIHASQMTGKVVVLQVGLR